MMQVLVIGYGSIGLRHSKVLQKLGCEVSIVSARKNAAQRIYSDINEAINTENPKYIVIANKTSEHIPTLVKIKKLGFNGDILVEKPLSSNLLDIPSKDLGRVFVAYNMRFNPLIQRLSKELKGETIISSQAYVGQYLPNWRPSRDYRLSYSAKKDEGGGDLRDLSHELDFMNWIFGGWKRVVAMGGKFSDLEINSDDLFGLMFETKSCPLCLLQLNYLDRSSRRDIIINTNQHVFRIDFINKTFEKDGVIIQFNHDSNYSYTMQHKAIIKREYENLCSFNEGREIVQLINAAEKSAYLKNNDWINNEKNL